MSQAELYDSRGKNLSRTALAEFAMRFLTDTPTADVAYFPGGVPDREGRQIYDKLGVPAHKRTWIERDRDMWPALDAEAQLQGTRVYHGDAKHFLRMLPATGRKFDMIGLDSTQVFGSEHTVLLSAAFKNSAFKPRGVLYTVFMGKREGDGSKSLFNAAYRMKAGVMMGGSHPISQMTEFWDLPSNPTAFDDQGVDLRDPIITEEVMRLAKRGRGMTDDLRYAPNEGNRVEMAKNKFAGTFVGQKIWDVAKEFALDMVESNEENKLNAKVAEMVNDDDLSLLLIANDREAYIPVTLERFFYHNNSDTPMYVDAFGFVQRPKVKLPTRAQVLRDGLTHRKIDAAPGIRDVAAETKYLFTRFQDASSVFSLPERKRLA